MRGQTAIVFSLQGCGSSCGVNVLLSSLDFVDPSAQIYRISVLPPYAIIQKPTAIPPSPRVTGVLSPSTTFWVSWLGGVISVGTGAVPRSGSPIVSFTDPSPTPVNYVAFSSSDVTPVKVSVFIPGPVLCCARPLLCFTLLLFTLLILQHQHVPRGSSS